VDPESVPTDADPSIEVVTERYRAALLAKRDATAEYDAAQDAVWRAGAKLTKADDALRAAGNAVLIAAGRVTP
jgi:hypothetical protein